MNQILSTENINNKKNKSKARGVSSGSKDIASIIRFFAIFLIIMGVLVIGSGAYALYSDGNKTNEPKIESKPQISIENKGEDKILITITDEEDIDNVTYQWNDEQEQTISGASGKFIQEELELPDGKNTLKVRALNINGGLNEISREFEAVASIGIKTSISGNNIKIEINSEEEIESFSYAWDDEEPTNVTVNDKKYSMEIEAIMGEHTLNIVAKDINGVEKTKEQQVVGTTKPTLKITKGDNAYHIVAYDEIGLDRVEVTTLNDGKITKMKSDGKEFEYDFPLKDGDENYVEIVAYNNNGVESSRIRAKWPR